MRDEDVSLESGVWSLELEETRLVCRRFWSSGFWLLAPGFPSSFIPHPSSLILILIIALVMPFGVLAQGVVRHRAKRAGGAAASRSHESVLARPVARLLIEQAMSAVCFERTRDSLASVPIDVMQAHPSLPLAHSSVIVGRARAERLLPLAQKLVEDALRDLGDKYKVPAWRIRVAIKHVRGVQRIEPDMELRDNAAVYLADQHTIRFGTIFLASLPSDEGMTSILAHELTHVADGPQDILHVLFIKIGRRAAALTGLAITGRRPEELSCDLVGEMVVRELVALAPTNETRSRRLARAVEHNCVELDNTDQVHLSPRNTLRALFALDATYERDFLDVAAPTLPTSPSINRAQPEGSRRTPLTTPHAHFYHPRLK
jgi:hypothetical protein